MSNPQVFVGEETTRSGIKWMEAKFKECFHVDDYTTDMRQDTYYNDGLLGAQTEQMTVVLQQMTSVLKTTSVKNNCNMGAITLVMNQNYKYSAVSGYPFHTVFTKYEQHSDAFIKHK